MRPLYAIAPLALLLALFGPTPHETNKASARLLSSKAIKTSLPSGERPVQLAAQQNDTAER